MNPTNDPALRSWVPVAPESHFPIQNLPYGVFRRRGDALRRIGVAIGDQVLDLYELSTRKMLVPPAGGDWALDDSHLNAFFSLGPRAWHEARSLISYLLRHDNITIRDDAEL